jgi:hypothetical protein
VVLPFRKKSVACLLNSFALKGGENCDDGSIVCDGCFGLVGKVDQVSFELDVCVKQLRAKANKSVEGKCD